jgi:polyhydroxyalkanoate synthesis regulator phasin
MKKLMGIVVVAGLAMMAGCEDKKAPAKGAVGATKDATKGAMDATKDAAKGAVDATKDAAKGAADAVKEKAADGMAAMRDKAVEMFKPQIETAKGKLDELVKKVEGLDVAKKAMATPLVETAKTAFADLSAKFDALKSSTDGGEKAKTGVESSMKTFTDAITKLTDAVK